jgi:hypothetical protein
MGIGYGNQWQCLSLPSSVFHNHKQQQQQQQQQQQKTKKKQTNFEIKILKICC